MNPPIARRDVRHVSQRSPRWPTPPRTASAEDRAARRKVLLDGAEVHDVPLAAPRDERLDVDGALFALDVEAELRTEDPKITDLIVLLTRLHPACARLGH